MTTTESGYGVLDFLTLRAVWTIASICLANTDLCSVRASMIYQREIGLDSSAQLGANRPAGNQTEERHRSRNPDNTRLWESMEELANPDSLEFVCFYKSTSCRYCSTAAVDPFSDQGDEVLIALLSTLNPVEMITITCDQSGTGSLDTSDTNKTSSHVDAIFNSEALVAPVLILLRFFKIRKSFDIPCGHRFELWRPA